jgi:hypothetical protein
LVSRNVIFLETHFPYVSKTSSTSVSDIVVTLDSDNEYFSYELPAVTTTHSSGHTDTTVISQEKNSQNVSNSNIVPDIPSNSQECQQKYPLALENLQ